MGRMPPAGKPRDFPVFGMTRPSQEGRVFLFWIAPKGRSYKSRSSAGAMAAASLPEARPKLATVALPPTQATNISAPSRSRCFPIDSANRAPLM